MPSPLLPTHARGSAATRTKQKRRSGGTLLKLVIYMSVVACVAYLLYAHFHARWQESSPESAGTSRRRARSEGDGGEVQGAAQNLKRQDAMRRDSMQHAHDKVAPDIQLARDRKAAEDIRRAQEAVTAQYEGSSDGGHGDKGVAQQHERAVATDAKINVEQREEQKAPEVTAAHPITAQQVPGSFFDLSATDIDGKLVHFSQYVGKVVVVVNVASACGYTDQNYKGLQQLYSTHKDLGLEILGFPCNQFGSQEAGSEAEIKDFCTGRYHVTFPMFSKIEVNGPNMHPVYQFLRRQLPASEGGGGGAGPGADLGWNFYKFLVNKQGQPVKRFDQTYDAPTIKRAVEELLHAPGGHDTAHTHSPVAHDHGAGHSQDTAGHQQAERRTVIASGQGDAVKAPEIHTHSVPPNAGGARAGADRAPDLAQSFFSLSATDIDGNLVHFSQYVGKVVLAVNVASACGYTDQNYKGLQKSYLKYKDHGLVILGFPCNQFGSQEPGNETEIKDFCTGRYHVTFPMFQKVEVNGPNMHPVYQFLRRQLPISEGGGGGSGTGTDLGWNFYKFLVNKQGQPVKRFDQVYDAPLVESEIYRLLHE